MTVENSSTAPVILSVRDLDVKFNLRGRVLSAIRGISLDLYQGESLAIVGESGSGKSVFTKTFMGLLDQNGVIAGGEILYNGQDLATFRTERQWRQIRGREIAMVLQDPMTSLNPLKTIGSQIGEAIAIHQGLRGAALRAKVLECLGDVGIPDPEHRYCLYRCSGSGMPTSLRHSSTLARRAAPRSPWWMAMASPIWLPTVLRGLRLVMGSWSTMAISRPRMDRHCFSVLKAARSWPL